MNAACIGCRLAAAVDRPSIVVTSAPSAWAVSTVQLFTASPFMWTVQAPQLVVSQPTCVPVSPSSSRSQWTSRSRASTSASRRSPLTVTSTWTVALIRLSSRSRSRLREPMLVRGYCGPQWSPSHFEFEGHRLVYDEYGEGERGRGPAAGPPVLAQDAPAAGRDARGARLTACSASTCSGTATRTARPRCGTTGCRSSAARRSRCSTTPASKQAVIGGTSLGANATLEAAAAAPERVQGHADRDAGARQRAARLRASPSRRCSWASRSARRWRALIGPRRAARAARKLAARRHDARLGRARTRSRPPRCSRGSSTGAWRRRARSGRR